MGKIPLDTHATKLYHVNLAPKTTPRTPNVRKKMSKRAFDGLISKWRRQLHEYDQKDDEDEENVAARSTTKGRNNGICLS